MTTIRMHKNDVWLCSWGSGIEPLTILETSKTHIRHKYGWESGKEFYDRCKEKIGVKKKRFGVFSYISR